MSEEQEEMRKFAPLTADHPAIGMQCILCGNPIIVGDETTLIPVAPASEEDKEKMLADRPYNAEAKIAHWRCWEFYVNFIKE